MSYDNTCKYLAERYPSAFVQWLLGIENQKIKILKTELLQESIHADSLTFLSVSSQVLHLEFQTIPRSKPPIPLRMLDYSVRLKRQYNCPVEQVVIFLQETNNEIAYTEVYQDQTTIHHYRVIRLWEQDPTLFLDSPGLLPLVSLTRSDSPSGLLARVAEKIDTIEDRKEKASLFSCTGLLAGLRFTPNLIRQCLREDIMRESAFYQDVLQEGRRMEILSVAIRLLSRRFGEMDSSLIDKVQGLSIEQLEALVEALLNIKEVSHLVLWLNEQN